MARHTVTTVTPGIGMPDDAVDLELERGAQRLLREGARVHRELAVEALVDCVRLAREERPLIVKGRPVLDENGDLIRVPPVLKAYEIARRAAMDLLMLGYGRPGTQELPRIPDPQQVGLVVNIVNYSVDGQAGPPEPVRIGVPDAVDVRDEAIDGLLAGVPDVR